VKILPPWPTPPTAWLREERLENFRGTPDGLRQVFVKLAPSFRIVFTGFFSSFPGPGKIPARGAGRRSDVDCPRAFC
jgi:hypothetical protein